MYATIGAGSRLRSRWLARATGTAALLMAWTGAAAQTFWVATGGSDTAGDGSVAAPWATITHAVDSVPDGSVVLVRPGTYVGRVRLRGRFEDGVTVRSEVPYRARLRADATVVTCFYGAGITLEGFDIAHQGPGAGALVVQVQNLTGAPPGAPESVRRITLRDNVIHDSFNNDLLKVNNGATGITVEGNLFYNQSGSDEHIDVNSVADVIVQDNVFFNDFEGSGRVNGNDTSSFVVIKDSNGPDDGILGAERIVVRRNVFLGWQGSSGANFVLAGEDGAPYHEALDVTVENNLLLGNSPNVMRAAFGVKGGKSITYRNNTVAGDLPSLAYAMRLNVEGANPANEAIAFYNNAWSDPTGTLGARDGTDANDFSDTPPGETLSFTLRGNAYWNGGTPMPIDPSELVNYTDDPVGVVGDPGLADQGTLVLPRWEEAAGRFADGSASVAAARLRLVETYASPGPGSVLVDAADASEASSEDILGNARGVLSPPDVGAYETAPPVTADLIAFVLPPWTARVAAAPEFLWVLALHGVANVGDAAAGPFPVQYLQSTDPEPGADDAVLGARLVDGLAPGAFWLRFTLLVVHEDAIGRRLVVWADPAATLGEARTHDNAAATPIPSPD